MASSSERIARVNATPFMQTSHFTITWQEGDEARGELAVHPESLNPHGFVHGGVLTGLADTVAGVAATSRGGRCVTVSSVMNYLRPAVGSRIFCRAEPVRVGKTISVFDTRLTDETGRLVATGTFTFHLDRSLPAPTDG